jgi:hypothetical protein
MISEIRAVGPRERLDLVAALSNASAGQRAAPVPRSPIQAPAKADFDIGFVLCARLAGPKE